jgi:hypothetical protein
MIAREWAVIIVIGVGVAGAGGDDLPAHILNLAREEHAIADELKHLPDYTCTETIDRFIAEGDKPLKRDDRIVIDIAIANRHELFAWPGQSFQERSVIDMVGHGFISDGDFATMMNNVFVGRGAVITYLGADVAKGRDLLRYDFHIPLMSSGWRMYSEGRIGVMGSVGSFWLDAESLDLVRMRFDAEDLPVWSTYKTIEEDVTYGAVVVGDSRLLLPASARITAVDFTDRKVQNHIAFTDCHKYSSESTISFGDPPPAPAALPAGMIVSVQLEKAIVLSRAVIGDEVVAAIPGGGRLKGVVRSLDSHNEHEFWWLLGIEFSQTVTLEDIMPFPGLRRNLMESIFPASPGRRTDLVYIPVTGKRTVIPAGVRLTLRTARAQM